VRVDKVADALDAGTPLIAGGITIRLAAPDDVRNLQQKNAERKTVA
jgi:hypothetical protein